MIKNTVTTLALIRRGMCGNKIIICIIIIQIQKEVVKGGHNEKEASHVCVTSIYYHFIWQIWKLQTLFNWNIILNISKKEQKKRKKIKIKLKVWRVNLRNSKDNQLIQRVKNKTMWGIYRNTIWIICYVILILNILIGLFVLYKIIYESLWFSRTLQMWSTFDKEVFNLKNEPLLKNILTRNMSSRALAFNNYTKPIFITTKQVRP